MGIGNDGSQSPLAASQPPSRWSKGTLVAGDDCAAAIRESTTPPNRRSGPPRAMRPKAAFAPSASTPGVVERDPGPVPVNSNRLWPPAPPSRSPAPEYSSGSPVNEATATSSRPSPSTSASDGESGTP